MKQLLPFVVAVNEKIITESKRMQHPLADITAQITDLPCSLFSFDK